MSKVLRMIDFDDLITCEHHNFIIDEEMRLQELKDENTTDDDRLDSYVDPDGDFVSDDIPF